MSCKRINTIDRTADTRTKDPSTLKGECFALTTRLVQEVHGTLRAIPKSLATLASGQGQHDDAIRLAKLANVHYLSVANSDPLDAEARMRVGSSWDTLYAVYRTAEKYSEANEAVSRGLEIFNELVVQHPTAAKYPVLAMEACMKWMDVQIRQGQLLEAANSMRRRAELVENWRNTTDAGTQDFEAAKRWSMNTERILTLAALGVDAIDEKQDIDPDTAYASKVLAAYALARRGEVRTALTTCESLKHYVASDPELAGSGKVVLARTYAILFRQRKMQQSKDPNTFKDPESDLALAGCAEVFRAIAEKNPAYLSYLSTEVDLLGIEQEPGFQQLKK
jgi:hypothetical protein